MLFFQLYCLNILTYFPDIKMEKDQKKVMRKQAKALQVVKKDFDICESEITSRNVLVCNAGLVTGASR